MEHTNFADMAAYVSQTLEPGESSRIDLHLGECDQCVEAVYQLHIIRDHFNEIWETLSLDDISKDLTRIALLESLLSANIKEAFLSRILGWLKNFHDKTLLISGIAVHASKKTAEIIQENLFPVDFPEQLPRFTLAPSPARILGSSDAGGISHQKMTGPRGEKIDMYISEDALQFKIQGIKTAPPFPMVWAFSPEKRISKFKETIQPAETDYLVAEFSRQELYDASEYIFMLEDSPITQP